MIRSAVSLILAVAVGRWEGGVFSRFGGLSKLLCSSRCVNQSVCVLWRISSSRVVVVVAGALFRRRGGRMNETRQSSRWIDLKLQKV